MYMEVSNKSKVVSCKFKDKYWFNDECRSSKKDYMKYKRSVKHLGAKERSEILKQQANRHKGVIKAAKRSYDKDLHHKLK